MSRLPAHFRSQPLGNLVLDGFEESARRVYRKVRSWHSQGVIVIVEDNGVIRLKQCRDALVSRMPPADLIVGTYDRKAQIETIENDMLYRIRELTSAITGVAA